MSALEKIFIYYRTVTQMKVITTNKRINRITVKFDSINMKGWKIIVVTIILAVIIIVILIIIKVTIIHIITVAVIIIIIIITTIRNIIIIISIININRIVNYKYYNHCYFSRQIFLYGRFRFFLKLCLRVTTISGILFGFDDNAQIFVSV